MVSVRRNDLPIPVWALVLSACVWAALLAITPLLGNPTSYMGQIAKLTVTGTASTAFGVVVAGLIVDRWKARQKRAQDERAQELADVEWLATNKVLIARMLAECRGEIALLTKLAYRAAVILVDARTVPADALTEDALAQPVGKFADRLGRPLDGPLADACEQVKDVMHALLDTVDVRTTTYENAALNRKPSADEPSRDVVPAERLVDFIKLCKIVCDDLVAQALSVYVLLDEFHLRYVGKGKDDALEPAVSIRLAAREFSHVARASVDAPPSEDDYKELSSQALTAVKLAMSLSHVLDASKHALAVLWTLETEWRIRVPKDDPLREALDQWMDSQRDLRQTIARYRWQSRKRRHDP